MLLIVLLSSSVNVQMYAKGGEVMFGETGGQGTSGRGVFSVREGAIL